MKKNYIGLIMLCCGLAGCDSRIDAVNQQMNTIRNQQPLPIEPAPVFMAVPTFIYSAMQLKSPFLPSSLAAELQIMAGKRVYPNFNRQPQPLESYALESLNMKGSLRSPKGQILGLIQTPDKQIERVQVGSYMGMNQGRIVSISPTQIDLVEIVADGHEGYVERPRTLVLIESKP